MAKWLNLRSSTNPNSMVSHADIQDNKIEWEINQEMDPYLEQAKFDRDNNEMKNGHVKKFATIPDLVSIEIMNKYGINIHDPLTFNDKDKMKKFKYIIQTEYKHLMAY